MNRAIKEHRHSNQQRVAERHANQSSQQPAPDCGEPDKGEWCLLHPFASICSPGPVAAVRSSFGCNLMAVQTFETVCHTPMLARVNITRMPQRNEKYTLRNGHPAVARDRNVRAAFKLLCNSVFYDPDGGHFFHLCCVRRQRRGFSSFSERFEI